MNEKKEVAEGDSKNYIAVPRKAIKGIAEDPFSKRLRKFENYSILYPSPNQSGVYINTNEHGVVETVHRLSSLPLVKDGVHVGFSGWHNFDIMAQRLSSRGLICDINPENTLFLHTALKYIRKYEDRDNFIKKMTLFINKYKYQGDRTTTRTSVLGEIQSKSIKFSLNVSEEYPYSEHIFEAEEVHLETRRDTSWLYTDARYKHIRTLALADKIAVITESICADDVFASISHLFTDNALPIDTLYISNISEWMSTPEQRQGFLNTLQSLLMDRETILIDARLVGTSNGKASLIQRCRTQVSSFKTSDWNLSFFPRSNSVSDMAVKECSSKATLD